MSAALAYLEDDLPIPRRARHLYLVAVDGRLIEHADRAELTTLPDDTSTKMEYGFGQDDFGSQRFKTTVTDGQGNVKTSFRDVRELITTVKEENRPFNNQGVATSQSKAEIVTRYVYDPLRQITHVIDAQVSRPNRPQAVEQFSSPIFLRISWLPAPLPLPDIRIRAVFHLPTRQIFQSSAV